MEEILHHFQRPTMAYTWNFALLIEYCLKTQWSKWICASDGNSAPPVNMSFNIELGGTGVQDMHRQMYGYRRSAGFDFFHQP